MKKLCFVLSMLLLSGCQMESTTGEEVAQSTEDKAITSNVTQVGGVTEQQTNNEEQEPAKEKEIKKATTPNSALSDVLLQAVRQHGVMTDNAILFNDLDVAGVLYAELIDVDADGQDELYLLTKTLADKTEGQPGEDSIFDNFYVHELWQAGTNGATQVFSKQMDAMYSYCESCGYSVSFDEREDGTWPLEFRSEEFFDEGARFTSEVYTLVNDEMQQSTHVLEIDDTEQSHYTIDGAVVDEEAYRAGRSGETITIIENTIGQMNFAFDGAEFKFDHTDSSATVISNVLAELNGVPNTLAQEGVVVDASTVQSAMEQLDVFSLVASHDPAFHADMLHTLLTAKIYLLAESDITDDPIADEYDYLAFSEALVLEHFERLYGVPFAGEHFDLREPSDENIVYTTYQDGVFYVRVSELATPATIHDIDAVYELSPNTYYIESTMRKFDWLNYSGSISYEQSFEEDSSQIFNEEPIDTWSNELRRFTHTGWKYYTVFQLNGDEMELNYYHYVPLSDAELTIYK